MTTIEKYLKQFEAYFNGNLDQANKIAFEDLIRQNNDVHAAWTEYCSLMEACTDQEAISLRSLLEKTYNTQYTSINPNFVFNYQWVKMAAAALIIIMIGSLLYYFNAGGENLSPQKAMVLISDSIISQHSTDTIQKLIVEEREDISNISATPAEIASIFDQEEYQISPLFAELLHNVYRSNWFRIISPEDSIMFGEGDSITFSWETNIKEPLYFDVLDRNGNVVYKESGAIASPWSYVPGLSPAIYMYRFATNDQPIWMGVMVLYY